MLVMFFFFLFISPRVLRGPSADRRETWPHDRKLKTFNFDREYPRNGSKYRISEKYLINYSPFHVGYKKFCELWSTNKRVIGAHTDPPKRTFFGRLYFDPWGVLLPQIFT